MTCSKTKIAIVAMAAMFGVSAAHAGTAPATFAELDANMDGQVNFTEYANVAQSHNKDMMTALREFHVITDQKVTFDEATYAKSFALQGEVNALDYEKTVVMPMSEEVTAEVEAEAFVIEALSEAETPVAVEADTELEVNVDLETEVDIQEEFENSEELPTG